MKGLNGNAKSIVWATSNRDEYILTSFVTGVLISIPIHRCINKGYKILKKTQHAGCNDSCSTDLHRTPYVDKNFEPVCDILSTPREKEILQCGEIFCTD